MRITLVNQFYRPDIAPTAHLAATLAEHRAELGDEVTIIAGRGSYTAKGVRTPGEARGTSNPRVLRVWTPGLGKSTNVRRVVDYAAYYLFTVLKLLTMRRQDLVISLTTPPLIAWAATLHKLLHRKTRVILWNMDCYPDVAERSGVIPANGFIATRIRERNRRIFERLDHLICLDSAMAELLCAQYAPMNPKLPVTIVPNFEDASLFPRDAKYTTWEGLEQLRLQDRFIVLYMGNMGYGHAFDTVLDAAEQLRASPVTFLFVGGGKQWKSVADEAKRRKLNNVVMHGYVSKEQTGAIMASSHCALVTLRDDALGVMSPSKAHANLALRLPLIYVGPTKSNVDDAIEQWGCGISLRHGDVAALVRFIERIRTDPAEHGRLRDLARDAFDGAYSDKATLPRFDAVIRHAISGESEMQGVPTSHAERLSGTAELTASTSEPGAVPHWRDEAAESGRPQ